MRTARISFFVALVLAFAPPVFSQESSKEWRGNNSIVSRMVTMVTRDQASWGAMWELAGQKPPQTVDFRSYMAIGIFMGMRPSGGYSPEILKLAETSDSIIVEWQEKQPTGTATQALTSPWVIKILPRAEKPVGFRSENVVSLPPPEYERFEKSHQQVMDRMKAAEAKAKVMGREQNEMLEEKNRLEADNQRLRREVETLQKKIGSVRDTTR